MRGTTVALTGAAKSAPASQREVERPARAPLTTSGAWSTPAAPMRPWRHVTEVPSRVIS
jgi:hypothetical protein